MFELVARIPHPAFGHLLPRKMARAKATKFHTPPKNVVFIHLERLVFQLAKTFYFKAIFSNIRLRPFAPSQMGEGPDRGMRALGRESGCLSLWPRALIRPSATFSHERSRGRRPLNFQLHPKTSSSFTLQDLYIGEAHFWRLDISSTLTVRCQGFFHKYRIFILGRV